MFSEVFSARIRADLRALDPANYPGGDHRAGQGLRGSPDVVSVDDHHRGQFDVGGTSRQSFHNDPLALFDSILLSAGGDYCVHRSHRVARVYRAPTVVWVPLLIAVQHRQQQLGDSRRVGGPGLRSPHTLR